MSKPLVSIITGNSNSGSSCIKELFDRYADKVKVRGCFRTKEKAEPFQNSYPKMETIIGADASQPDTLKVAFEGAQSALIVTPSGSTKNSSDDAELTNNMIHKAVEAGVKYIVLVGSVSAGYNDVMPIIASRFLPSEQLLEKLSKQKGIKFTVLRGGYFMENVLSNFKKSISERSAIDLPNIHVAMVDTKDIGKSAAACLITDGAEHNGKYYQMNGPEIIGGEDIAKILTRVLGKPIKYNELTKEKIKSTMPLAIVQMYEHMIDGGKTAIPFTDDVKRLTGQHGTFEQFIINNKDYFN